RRRTCHGRTYHYEHRLPRIVLGRWYQLHKFDPDFCDAGKGTQARHIARNIHIYPKILGHERPSLLVVPTHQFYGGDDVLPAFHHAPTLSSRSIRTHRITDRIIDDLKRTFHFYAGDAHRRISGKKENRQDA